LYPQTQNGTMNVASAYALETSTIGAVTNGYPDAAGQPLPTASGSTFTVGKNFASPATTSGDLNGLTYAFDYLNARLVLIDQFTPSDSLNLDGTTAHTLYDAVPQQQSWINTTVGGKPSSGHAFVFAHKGIITQQHIDVLFGDCPADSSGTFGGSSFTVASNGANNFITGISQAGARLFFCGHDHMHNRSIVKTTSGTAAQILHQLCQSVSSKFYTPNEDNPNGNGAVPAATSNDAFFCGGQRQSQLSQELYTVGFYIVTVDGANVTVDYYSAPAYPTYGSGTEDVITATPTLNFTKQESYGYGLNGKEFLVASGGTYTGVHDTGPSGTVAKILGGTNSNPNTDRSGRIYYNDVNTGWFQETAGTASDILVLWGMARNLGSPQTDVFVLSMSYDAAKGSSFVLATTNGAGVWVNAVDQNTAGTKKLVNGPWKSGYPLGTYGIDTTAKTVWAVLNYNGYFAAVTSA
ncbi:MAG: hypothetical protein P4L36_13560, partial [Holophaga sp.]|nr:hypothetical protein [Holophaga sp.]